MKKKGELTLEELVKIVLAVAGIAILLLLAFNLYKAFSTNTTAERAKMHLEKIEKSSKKLEDGQDMEYLITGLKGWYLVGYESFKVSNPIGKYNSTSSCENKDCICFCKVGEELITHENTNYRDLRVDPVTGIGTGHDRLLDLFYQSEEYSKGYLECEKESVCFKGTLRISSYEVVGRNFVPWIRLNSSATNIKIRGGEYFDIISRVVDY